MVKLSVLVFCLFIINIVEVLFERVEEVFVVIVLLVGLNMGCSLVNFVIVVFGWIILL